MNAARPAAEFRVDFRRKQMGIASCDIDIKVFMGSETIENADKFLEVLNLVEEETIRTIVLDLVFDVGEEFAVVDEPLPVFLPHGGNLREIRVQSNDILLRIERKTDDMVLVKTVRQEPRGKNLVKEIRFSTTANASDDLDQMVISLLNQEIQILLALKHGVGSLPFIY